MADAVLDVVAEDPQEEQVAGDVEPSAVHEHARQERQPDRAGPGLLRDGDGLAADLDRLRLDKVDAVGDLERHRAVAVGELLPGRTAGALEQEEDGDVEADECEAHERWAMAPLVLVADGEHRRDDRARAAP